MTQQRRQACKEKHTENNLMLVYNLLFYLKGPSLSRTLSQRNSIFITKLVSYARERTVVLLLLPLLFLLRSSQMVCLREINGFLGRLLCLPPLVLLACSSLLGGLDTSRFQEAPEGERPYCCGEGHRVLCGYLSSNPSSATEAAALVTSPSPRVLVYKDKSTPSSGDCPKKEMRSWR